MMKASAKLKIIIALILVAAFFVSANVFGFSKQIKNFFYTISSPIQKSLWNAGGSVSDFFSGIFNSQELKKENEDLQNKNQKQLAEIAALQEIKKENETLRTALGIGLQKDFKLIFADIIGKDVSGDSILINKGTKDGLSVGMPVITAQKTLAGRVSEVYEKFSRIMLVTDKNSTFDAEILAPYRTEGSGAGSSSSIYGVVKGKGNSNLSLELVPRTAELKEGDPVITASLGGVFPEGILAGTVKTILKNDVESFQSAELNPAFDLGSTDYLFVISDF